MHKTQKVLEIYAVIVLRSPCLKPSARVPKHHTEHGVIQRACRIQWQPVLDHAKADIQSGVREYTKQASVLYKGDIEAATATYHSTKVLPCFMLICLFPKSKDCESTSLISGGLAAHYECQNCLFTPITMCASRTIDAHS